MTARPIDGKAHAQRIKMEVAAEVERHHAATGKRPGLAVVLVGEDPASRVYVRNKQKMCEEAGMRGTLVRLPAETSTEALLAEVDRLNGDPETHGILVQLPLPRGIDERAVIERIDPLRDVDGFHPDNAGRLAIGTPRFVPCTPLGIRELLVAESIPTRGAHVVVLGRSQIVGKSVALLLMMKGEGGDATVTVCHTGTPDPSIHTREADILIAAMGKPEAIPASWIKPGAVVIDVGIHRKDDGSLCGDVDYAAAAEVASRITPVPGGVGPMTVAMLLQNTLTAFEIALGIRPRG
ncbi:MAG: bifunctional methylenetetrahydrofolate dehydrogenase/methenyltetrahydrofolate cyclohydrolase FolD [Isosphaeraceae bacterium]|nr:bifunctional methylenetetrahydrofolate dehydrogenase/methenyltetrahydrofolate cyclohydrolase FolD [Isosphaeraceae bacterium]